MNEPSTSTVTNYSEAQNSLQEDAAHRSKINKFKQRKQQAYNWPKERKLLKLASYSPCRECKCIGWKNPNEKNLSYQCEGCNHILAQHVSRFKDLPDVEINQYIGMAIDAENIFMSLHKEKDEDSRKGYYYLYKLIRRSLIDLRSPIIDAPLGKPPFERPSIQRAVMNFCLHKCGHYSSKDWNNMLEVGKIFLNTLNNWRFESPYRKKQNFIGEDLSSYTVNYTRWFLYCYVPTFCDSLTQYNMTKVFGRTFLQIVFKYVKKQLLDKCYTDMEKVPAVKKELLTLYFPRFLGFFEEELFSNSSPVWNPDFKRTLPSHITGTSKGGSKLGPDKQSKSIEIENTTGLKRGSSEISDGIRSNMKVRKIHHMDNEDISESIVNKILDDLSETQDNASLMIRITTPPVLLAKAEEESGQIEIVFAYNSLEKPTDRTTMLRLIGLQGVFYRELSEMPIEHITRLIFDPNHKTIAILKNGRPIGGICFRLFQTQGFSEIVFCAIKFSEHYKGYGTHLMNRLKDYHIKIGIHNFLTFADKDAVDYFKKQGFTEKIEMDISRYQGYIKEYDEATLMYCELEPRIVYSEFPLVLKQQTEVLKKLLEEKKKAIEVVTHPGLTCFKPPGIKCMKVEEIPGLKETGLKPAIKTTRFSKRAEEPSDPNTLYAALDNVLNMVKSHEMAWPFQEPVNKAEVPDYYDHIQYPMDLKTVGERLKAGYYATKRLFIADMQRIFNNCRVYNLPDTEYFICAKILDRFFQTTMKEHGLWEK